MAAFRKSARWKRARAAEIAKRDGPGCWLCTLPIPKAPKRPGRRASIEHLVARSAGGGNDLANLVLCHDSCNRHLGGRSIKQKLKMREKWHRARGCACNGVEVSIAAAGCTCHLELCLRNCRN